MQEHRWRLKAVASFISLFCAVTASSMMSAQDASSQKADTSSNNQQELQVQKASIDRRLLTVQSQLNSWKLVVVPLTGIIQQVEATKPPTVQDFDRLEQAVKKKDYGLYRTAVLPLTNAYQPFMLRIRFQALGASQQLDPDTSLIVNDWDMKLTQTTQPISDEINLLFRSTYSQESPEGTNVSDLRRDLSPDSFSKYKTAFLSLLHSDLDLVNQSKDKLSKDEADLQRQSDEIATKLAKGKLEINQLAIELGLPLFCGTVLLMLSIPIIVQTFSRAAGSGEQVRAIFSSGILVEIITVLLLTMSILILGLANRIEGPVLGTLLGGISGYVLNRFRGKTPQGDKSADEKKPLGPPEDEQPQDAA